VTGYSGRWSAIQPPPPASGSTAPARSNLTVAEGLAPHQSPPATAQIGSGSGVHVPSFTMPSTPGARDLTVPERYANARVAPPSTHPAEDERNRRMAEVPKPPGVSVKRYNAFIVQGLSPTPRHLVGSVPPLDGGGSSTASQTPGGARGGIYPDEVPDHTTRG